ncbi:MAG: bifunctional glutamate N-acetyltransferase/amino-acid acetyltransferase ArgJ [Desulfoplanes sp.]|nr:bifunctional glutamate N-acetyltransferase/amino-acid acetyltransferase ArgJ [Desulfoplanes sp.]
MFTIPAGYTFSAVSAGFKYTGRNDLSLIVSECPAHAAGVFTTNRFQAAPVVKSRTSLDRSPMARAILVNAGQANACTGDEGLMLCDKTRIMVGEKLGMAPEDILVASTGVIGDQLRMDLWEKAVPELVDALGHCDALDMAKAIMTTDTFPKVVSKTVSLEQGEIRLLGMCKGAGMICPHMATMLGFVICDAQVEDGWWAESLRAAVDVSFNAITVDGDTSTNDCILALANGASGVCALSAQDKRLLKAALIDLCQDLAFRIVQDAEGGTKVLRIAVSGARSKGQAEIVARVVGHSPLVKTALYGQDPNWGRIVAAIGRSGADFNPDEVSVALGDTVIFQKGQPVDGDWDSILAPVLKRDEINVQISLGSGRGKYELLASDLTEEYIKINAQYRT